MDAPHELIRSHLDVVYLLYGLAFVLLGAAILLLPKHGVSSPFVRKLWLLAAFGITHGTKEWLDLWRMLKGGGLGLDLFRTLLLAVSFGFLFEFGRRLVRGCGCGPSQRGRLADAVGAWLYLPLGLCLLLAAAIDPLRGLAVGSRYLVAFPGSLLTATGLVLCARRESEAIESGRLSTAFHWTAAAFAVYGVVGGLIPERGSLFPSNVLNDATFFAFVGLPVQLFRAACAVLVVLTVTSMLRLYHNEGKQRLRSALSVAQSSLLEIRKLGQRNELILEAVGQGICGLGRDGKLTFVNSAAADMLGWRPEELFGKSVHATIHHTRANGSVRERASCPIESTIREGAVHHVDLDTFWRRDGSPFEVAYSSTPMLEEGRVVGAVVAFRDVTRMRETERHLRQAALVLEHMPEGVMITDARGRIQSTNPAFGRSTGYESAEVVGKRPWMLRSPHHPDAYYREIWTALRERGSWQGEIWIRRKGGDIFPEWLAINALRDGEGRVTNYIGICSDIDTHREVKQRLHHLAYYDNLTGLPNRQLFQDRLDVALTQARRAGERVGVMFLDLDRFKHVNDTLGHSVGDRILRAVAGRLQTAVRAGDTIARLGGDEFTIIVPELKTPLAAALVARKVLNELALPVALEGREFYITASIGISVYPEDGRDRESLTRKADMAMYRAKELGRNKYQLYHAEMSKRFRKRLALENDLRRALDGAELHLVYQPQVALPSGRLVGVEALARWQHPRLGMVPPSTFIPIAEETGLIDRIGDWCLETACAEARQWMRGSGERLRVAVNLSPHQLRQPGFAQHVADVLQRSGMTAAELALELTETALMENSTANRTALRVLGEMGVQITIDDFGMGYSSLSYIKRLSIDGLKIDQSFVRDIPHDPSDRTLASMIIAMAHASDIRVTAEGVERREQLDFLREQGCDEVQGFLLSEPVPAPRIARMLESGIAVG